MAPQGIGRVTKAVGEGGEEMKIEERHLHEMKQHYDAVEIPDSIDDAILAGHRQGRKKRHKRMIMRMTAIAACLFIVIAAGAIRISPAFAAYVGSIPGMDAVVKMIRFDKGLQDAVHNGFIQPIHVSDSHNGVTFTVNNFIADDSRLILFYKLQAKDPSHLFIESVNMRNAKGKKVPVAIGNTPFTKSKNNRITGRLSFSYGDHAHVPNVAVVSIKVKNSKGVWSGSVNIPLNKKLFKSMKQVLPVHQTLIIQHQKIHFEKAVIYPTRIAVYVKFDPRNSKQIFGFDKLKLVDAKGETWSTITDGVLATDVSNNKRILYFQSNYFTEPRALYLEGSSVRALDKSQMNLVVDLKDHKLLKEPKDGRIKLYEVKKFDHKIRLGFTIRTNKWNQFSSFMPTTYHDATGKTFSSILQETGSEADNGSNIKRIEITIKNEHFHGPLTFRIADYPTRLKKPFKIKIK